MILEILIALIVIILSIFGMAAFKFYKIIRNFLPPGVLHPAPAPAGDSLVKSKKYKFVLWKTYFDTGFSITSYIKYLIAIFGISSLQWKLAIGLFVSYGILCILIGYIWITYGFFDAQNEVSNQFNPFVKEVRERKNI